MRTERLRQLLFLRDLKQSFSLNIAYTYFVVLEDIRISNVEIWLV